MVEIAQEQTNPELVMGKKERSTQRIEKISLTAEALSVGSKKQSDAAEFRYSVGGRASEGGYLSTIDKENRYLKGNSLTLTEKKQEKAACCCRVL